MKTPASRQRPYDLRPEGAGGGRFAQQLETLTQDTMWQVEQLAPGRIDEYRDFLLAHQLELERSQGEYAVELLTLGVLWRRYADTAAVAPRLSVALLTWLFSIRTRAPRLKPAVDRLRGLLSVPVVAPEVRRGSRPVSRGQASLERLLRWLVATGEFKDEAKRLRNWALFCAAGGPLRTAQVVADAEAILQWFEPAAEAALGRFTDGVKRFLEEEHPSHRGREDYLFCGKVALEYHLNLVASALMNRGLRAEFLATSRRAVLAPGCMRPASGERCRAATEGLDIRCRRCDRHCAVARIDRLGEEHGFEVFVVPHSSSFTRWLRQWQDRPDYGVVAVACALNIAPGGYEMRELGIPAQCVVLDYSGCAKHWHPTGMPTDLDDRQLLAVVGSSSTPGAASALGAASPGSAPPGPKLQRHWSSGIG
jgi:hypothetical protein